MRNYWEIWTRKPKHELSEFKAGQLVRMSAGAHTSKSYVVLVEYVDPFPVYSTSVIMVIGIPSRRSLEITNNNFGYHWRRMSIIGPLTDENRYLLYDQIIE